MDLRAIAFYLPQYHPIAENDQWWGKGFTEWTNVTKAKPKFAGHYQPHLPADFGYYDLRISQVLADQASMAREYGIYGFCFYHYWFMGKRLLERPLENLLRQPEIECKYCLCWANENWTRNWDGQFTNVLQSQSYSDRDDEEHFQYLRDFFKDDRYIKVDGKPLFIVYRQELLPTPAGTINKWRNLCRSLGIGEVYFACVDKYDFDFNPTELNFDASIEFQPNWRRIKRTLRPNVYRRLLHKLRVSPSPLNENRVVDYLEYTNSIESQNSRSNRRFPGAFPMWDNSPRRNKNATIFVNSTPENYFGHLSSQAKNFSPLSNEENFIFINAWNEWGEGCHLEPCRRWGHSYLQATKSVLGTL